MLHDRSSLEISRDIMPCKEVLKKQDLGVKQLLKTETFKHGVPMKTLQEENEEKDEEGEAKAIERTDEEKELFWKAVREFKNAGFPRE